MIEVAEVLVLSAGEVIATTGTEPRLTVTVAGVPAPKVFEHATVIRLPPIDSEELLVVALAEGLPPTVHVVPPGIEAFPLTV